MKTLQDAFNKAYLHLLKQNSTSMYVDEAGIMGCAYRGDAGNQCGIGCLIEDTEYSPSLEGRSAANPAVLRAIHSSGYPADYLSAVFYLTIQDMHDEVEPQKWPSCLSEIAHKAGLTVPELPSA